MLKIISIIIIIIINPERMSIWEFVNDSFQLFSTIYYVQLDLWKLKKKLRFPSFKDNVFQPHIMSKETYSRIFLTAFKSIKNVI